MNNLVNYILQEATQNNNGLSKMIYINSDDYYQYELYGNKEKRKQLCDLIEQGGYSCRVGIGANWVGNLSMQSGYIEVSNKIKFKHKLVEDYHTEIECGKC